MRFLHTADWHLGRTLAGRDLLLDQAHTLEHLVEIARAASLDAIVIAGDVFDRSQPAEDSLTLFSETLTQLQAIAPVLCIAGNHDSPGRISYAGALLAKNNVHMAGVELGAPTFVDIQSEDATSKVRFHLMPFGKPEEVRAAFEVDAIRTHEDATRTRVAAAEISTQWPNVLIGHLFAQGCHPSDSERDIAVGGIPYVDTSQFKRFAYTALGHLHQPHDVPNSNGRARYSGSIGRFSFSEEKHKKGVTIVTIAPDSTVSTEHVGLRQRIGMLTIRGKFDAIIRSAEETATEQRAANLVRVELLDTTLIFDAHARLANLYPNLVELWYENPTSTTATRAVTAESVRTSSPLELFKDFLDDRGNAISEDDKIAINSIATDCMSVAMNPDCPQ